MNISSVIVSVICIAIVLLGIYMLIKNIRNQLKGNGCGSCKNCSGSCDRCNQSSKK